MAASTRVHFFVLKRFINIVVLGAFLAKLNLPVSKGFFNCVLFVTYFSKLNLVVVKRFINIAVFGAYLAKSKLVATSVHFLTFYIVVKFLVQWRRRDRSYPSLLWDCTFRRWGKPMVERIQKHR